MTPRLKAEGFPTRDSLRGGSQLPWSRAMGHLTEVRKPPLNFEGATEPVAVPGFLSPLRGSSKGHPGRHHEPKPIPFNDLPEREGFVRTRRVGFSLPASARDGRLKLTLR